MALSRTIAAKISAYYTSWVDPEEFAEKGLVYRQRHHGRRREVWSFFVIGKGDKILPLDQLTDLNYADNLLVVLPYDAVNSEILSVLSSIETARCSGKAEVMFEIDVVGEVGKDASTGETRYGCVSYGSTEDLIRRMEEVTRKGQLEQGVQGDISRLTDA